MEEDTIYSEEAEEYKLIMEHRKERYLEKVLPFIMKRFRFYPGNNFFNQVKSMEKPIYQNCPEHSVSVHYCKWKECSQYEECMKGGRNAREI